MLDTNQLLMQDTFNQAWDHKVAQRNYIGQAARALYHRARVLGWLGRAWALLSRRPRRLLELNDYEQRSSPGNRHYAGLQTVPLKRIRGSEGKGTDFDADFNLLQRRSETRWLAVATARLHGASLPPVELVQIGETYFVRDGHHRISVARAMGEEFVEAEVTVWQEPLGAAVRNPAGVLVPQANCAPAA